jgi:23S rRNA (guanosine2251-2'-O)-methyltransferase
VNIIEGKNPVIELLKTGHPVNRIVLADNLKHSDSVNEILRLSHARGIPVEYVPRHDIEKCSSSMVHQGVIAYAAVKDYINLEDLLTLSQGKKEPALYVILDGIEDPQNLGSILRTAYASGIQGVIIRSRRAVGITATVARTSAGAAWHIPVARVSSIPQVIERLKKNNIWVIGIDQRGKDGYRQIDFRLPAAIVIGSEGSGLSELSRKRCDFLAHIPMRGEISSLNASIAAALVMYEAFNQRNNCISKY